MLSRRAAAAPHARASTHIAPQQGPHLTEWGVKTAHNLSMGAELCGVRGLVEPLSGLRTRAFRLGEWFTPWCAGLQRMHSSWLGRRLGWLLGS